MFCPLFAFYKFLLSPSLAPNSLSIISILKFISHSSVGLCGTWLFSLFSDPYSEISLTCKCILHSLCRLRLYPYVFILIDFRLDLSTVLTLGSTCRTSHFGYAYCDVSTILWIIVIFFRCLH